MMYGFGGMSVVGGIVMLLVFVALVVNLLVDVLYVVIDPRLRSVRR